MTVLGAHREETLCFIILHVVYILFGLILQRWSVLVMLSQKRMKRPHPWRQLNANSVAVLLKSICHHHWCTRRIQKRQKEHTGYQLKTSQNEKKGDGVKEGGRSEGWGGGRRWGGLREGWVGDWDDESGLRSESGSEGWAGITKVISQADTRQQGRQR